MAMKLLVVDDEPAFGDLVATIAAKNGFDAHVTTSGEKFQRVFNVFRPDVAVIDIVMPELDGFELVDWLGTQDHSCPLVFVTGKRPEYVRQAAILAETAGLDVAATLEKPISSKGLTDVLDTLSEP